jgi:hypothetical protein
MENMWSFCFIIAFHNFATLKNRAYLSMPKFLSSCHYNEEESSGHLKKKNIGYWLVQMNGNKFATGEILRKPVEVVKGRIWALLPLPIWKRIHLGSATFAYQIFLDEVGGIGGLPGRAYFGGLTLRIPKKCVIAEVARLLRAANITPRGWANSTWGWLHEISAFFWVGGRPQLHIIIKF